MILSPVTLIALIALVSAPLLHQLGPSIAGVNNLPAARTQEIQAAPAPPVRLNDSEPNLVAASVIAYDRASGSIIYSKNADQKRPIASITKLATAAVIVSNHQLDKVVQIPPLPTYQPGDELIGLQAGERYQIRDLLRALLVNSANDAADALAIIDSGSKEAFSANMTQKMRQWGIEDATFSNPSGLTDEGNAASARAVLKMGLLDLHNPLIKQLVATQTTSITSLSGRAIPLNPTNKLLQNGQFKGIKTGYTLASGQCFIGLTSVKGHEIITVVLASPDRFGESQALANWIERTFQWQQPQS